MADRQTLAQAITSEKSNIRDFEFDFIECRPNHGGKSYRENGKKQQKIRHFCHYCVFSRQQGFGFTDDKNENKRVFINLKAP